jgi:hypothetical protein
VWRRSPSWGIILGAYNGRGGSEVVRSIFSTSTMVGLGGMVSWSLDGGHVLRCMRRAEEPSSAVMALVVGSVWILASIEHSGYGSADSGRGKFHSTRTRHYLRIVPGSRHVWSLGHKALCLASCVCTSLVLFIVASVYNTIVRLFGWQLNK